VTYIFRLLIATSFLGGCATSYQSTGFTGGHSLQNGYGRLEKISFAGNGFITPDKVQKYALYRCAEVANEKKKAYFLMYETLVKASLGESTKLPTIGAVGNKPNAFAFVLFLDESRPGALKTAEVIADLSELVTPSKQ
jgi:hypothetical protein